MADANDNIEARIGKKHAELSQNFKTWGNSLFDLPEEQIDKLIIMDFEDKMWYTDALYSAAAILLRKENISSAAQYITYTLEENPKSIHAWCNQGVYCLSQRPPQLQQAEEAAAKMQELLREDKSKSDAILEKAYWLYSKDRSAEAREKAVQMFENQFSGRKAFLYSNHYLYMKTLLGELKRERKRQKRKGYIKKLVDQFTILAQSEDKIYELEMWSCLAEIQHLPSSVELLQEIDLTKLKRVTGCDKPDVLHCTNKMLEIQVNCPQVPIYSNFYYRVGNNFLELSLKANNKGERIEMLNKALRYSKEYLNTPASSFEKSPVVCAKVLLWLWAINFYEEHRDEVDKYVEERDRPKSVFPEEHDEVVKCWSYLAECYYSVTPDVSPTTRPYLEEARIHLGNAMKPGRSYPSVQYPRILMLLGETEAEVEKAFVKVKGEDLNFLWLAHQGMFYEEMGNAEKAIKFYKAVERIKTWSLAGPLSTNGLSRLVATDIV